MLAIEYFKCGNVCQGNILLITMYSGETGQTDGQRGYRALSYSRPSSIRILHKASGKGNCLCRQRSLSESDADSKEYGETGQKPTVSFVVANDSDVDSTGNVNIKPNIDEKAINLHSSVGINELSGKGNCLNHQRSLSELDADSKEHVEARHKPVVSFVVENDSDRDSTDYVCMNPKIHQKAKTLRYNKPSSLRIDELPGKRNCFYRQRSLSESDADSKEYGEAGHNPKISFVVENESDGGTTDYVCMKPKIHKKAVKLPSWPSSIRTNELSVERNCYYRQRSLSESDADSKEQVEAGHKPKISFVVENESDVKSTDYVCMLPSIHKTTMKLPSWPTGASPVL